MGDMWMGQRLKKRGISYTPVERRGDIWIKRDDLYSIAGVNGGKARTCWHLAQGAPGLVTAGARSSPQVNIVAHIAKELGVPCRCHVPWGESLPEVKAAASAGAEIEQHKPGYNSVIIARARDDAAQRGWREIPFGMECFEAVKQTARQVENLPPDIERIVVPVGSGMSLAGILTGLCDNGRSIPILGVKVGADPTTRLDRYAPQKWRELSEIVDSGIPYSREVHEDFPIKLDPIYEAKCVKLLKPGDLLWVVGIRESGAALPSLERPDWVSMA